MTILFIYLISYLIVVFKFFKFLRALLTDMAMCFSFLHWRFDSTVGIGFPILGLFGEGDGPHNWAHIEDGVGKVTAYIS